MEMQTTAQDQVAVALGIVLAEVVEPVAKQALSEAKSAAKTAADRIAWSFFGKKRSAPEPALPTHCGTVRTNWLRTALPLRICSLKMRTALPLRICSLKMNTVQTQTCWNEVHPCLHVVFTDITIPCASGQLGV